MTGPQRRVLGLTAAATWLALVLIRSAGPLISQLFDIGVSIAAGAAVVAFAGSAGLVSLATFAGRAIGEKQFGHGSAVFGLAGLAVALRLTMPFTSGTVLVVFGLVAVSSALGLLVVAVRGAAGAAGGAGIVSASAIGACAAVLEQGVLHTWDSVWRHDALGWVAAAALSGTVLASAWRARRTVSVTPVRGLWTFGLWLSLLAFAFANLAFVSSQTGLHLGVALVLAVAGLAGGAALAAGRPNGSPPTVAITGILTILATGAMLAFHGGIASVSLPIASAGVAYVASRALDPRSATTSSSPRMFGAAVGFGIATLLPFMAVQLDYDIPLGFPHLLVIVATVATIAVLGALRTRAHARTGTMLPAATGVRVRAAVAIATAVLVAVPTQFTFNIGVPDALPLPSDLRVVSWNLHYGVTPGLSGGPGIDIDAMVAAISAESPDVVLLQEVERGWILAGGTDLLQLLADGLGMGYAYVGAHDQQFGNAILSRYPLNDTVRISLPYGTGPQGRSAVSATVDTINGPMRFAALHLQHKENSATRVAEVEAFLAYVPDGPSVDRRRRFQ